MLTSEQPFSCCTVGRIRDNFERDFLNDHALGKMAAVHVLFLALATIFTSCIALSKYQDDSSSLEAKYSEQVTTVHLISSCHLDVGFADTAAHILDRYFVFFFPSAIIIANELKQRGGEERLVFTTHSYLVYLYLNCPPNMGFHCPNSTEVDSFVKAIEAGDIVWHAYAFNGQPEIMEPSLFEFGVYISHWLDDKFNKTHKTTMSQRDVPGLTRGVIPLLNKMGVEAITVGVNSASMPPAVPEVFRWLDKASSKDVVAMWHPGGYGGPPNSLSNMVVVPGMTHALAFAIRGDNTGPPPTKEVLANYQAIKKLFPNATVIASTYDAFVAELLKVKSQLPVVSGEIGDTWIYGTASDPGKIAQFREMMSLRSSCLASGQCSLDDPQFFNFSALLLKSAEHTWGKDIKKYLHDSASWTNENFQNVIHDKNFVDVVNSWVEQRQWGITYPLEALGNHPLGASIRKALADLKFDGHISMDGYKLAEKPYNFKLSNFEISFDETTGAIVDLTDMQSSQSVKWASTTNPLFTLLYQTFTPADYDTFFSEYFYRKASFAIKDFGKPGLELNDTEHFEDRGTLSSLYVSESGASFITVLQYSPMLVHDFGAPYNAWVKYNYTSEDRAFEVTVYVQWALTRRPEALSLVLQPPVGGMMVNKLGSVVDVTDVVKNGSQHLHGQYRGGVSVMHATTPSAVMNVTAMDSTLMGVGWPNPFPTPATKPDYTKGFSFNLLNNIWGTNYVMWYPFTEEDNFSKFRFKLTLTQT